MRVVVEQPVGPAGAAASGNARYFGRAKTKFQLYLAATVANLTLVAGKTERCPAVPVAAQKATEQSSMLSSSCCRQCC